MYKEIVQKSKKTGSRTLTPIRVKAVPYIFPSIKEIRTGLPFKHIHFFFNDIGLCANCASEECWLLKNRRANFGEAESAEDIARGLFDAVPQRGLRRENVAHAFDGLEFGSIGQWEIL